MPTNNSVPINDFPDTNLQHVWQNQPTEAMEMSAENLRQKAQQRQTKARRIVLFSSAIALVLFLWFGWGFLSFSANFQSYSLGPVAAWIARLGLAVLCLWSLYSGYKTYKILWPSPGASDANLKTTLHSYRLQLEKRRDYNRNIWVQSGLIFCFLGMAMLVVPLAIHEIASPLRMLANLAPLLVLFILWLAIFIPQRRRRLRTLQQEIDQLRAFENSYPM